jgi:hypothetical protein
MINNNTLSVHKYMTLLIFKKTLITRLIQKNKLSFILLRFILSLNVVCS